MNIQNLKHILNNTNENISFKSRKATSKTNTESHSQEKLLNELENMASANMSFKGKGHLPRYLYHLTSQENYEKMLEDGFMFAKPDDIFKHDGVYFLDLVNFIKDWAEKNKDYTDDLRKSLFSFANKGSKNLVLLKVPTKNLENKENLKIRSQNRLFRFIDFYGDYRSNSTEKDIDHLSNGDNAKNSSLYKQRKEAIEYIYKGDIPIEIVEKIGEVNLKNHSTNDIRGILKELLNNTPEINMLNLREK